MTIASQPADQSLVPQSRRGDWTWEMVSMYPRQGDWTEAEYLGREFDGLVEFVDGMLEFQSMTTFPHQDLVAALYRLLDRFIGPRSPAEVYFSPIRVRTTNGNIREPDVAYIQASRIVDRKQPSAGADLVMEVVSESTRDRETDYYIKREEYAAAGISEYWIVDPQARLITVLTLHEGAYQIHGEFKPGMIATSIRLPGFTANVAELFGMTTG